MPPRPSRPMIRYRPSKSTPGAKRPWLIESEDVSQPLDEGVAAVAALRCVRAPPDDWVMSLTPIVSTSEPAGAPHDAQKRAASGRTAWQFAQRIAGIMPCGGGASANAVTRAVTVDYASG